MNRAFGCVWFVILLVQAEARTFTVSQGQLSLRSALGTELVNDFVDFGEGNFTILIDGYLERGAGFMLYTADGAGQALAAEDRASGTYYTFAQRLAPDGLYNSSSFHLSIIGNQNAAINCTTYPFLLDFLAPDDQLLGDVTLTLRNLHVINCGSDGIGAVRVRKPRADPNFMKLVVEDCVFSDNNMSSPISLDAFELFPDSPLQIGGAIYAQNFDQVVIRNCIFDSNVAKYGGAVAIDSAAETIISGCRFHGNTARVMGGAIKYETLIGNASLISGLTLESSVFKGNLVLDEADRLASGLGAGGALAVYRLSTHRGQINVNIADCIFRRNQAHVGAIFSFGVDVSANITNLNSRNDVCGFESQPECFGGLMTIREGASLTAIGIDVNLPNAPIGAVSGTVLTITGTGASASLINGVVSDNVEGSRCDPLFFVQESGQMLLQNMTIENQTSCTSSTGSFGAARAFIHTTTGSRTQLTDVEITQTSNSVAVLASNRSQVTLAGATFANVLALPNALFGVSAGVVMCTGCSVLILPNGTGPFTFQTDNATSALSCSSDCQLRCDVAEPANDPQCQMLKNSSSTCRELQWTTESLSCAEQGNASSGSSTGASFTLTSSGNTGASSVSLITTGVSASTDAGAGSTGRVGGSGTGTGAEKTPATTDNTFPTWLALILALVAVCCVLIVGLAAVWRKRKLSAIRSSSEELSDKNNSPSSVAAAASREGKQTQPGAHRTLEGSARELTGIRILQKLGEGNFGAVYKGDWSGTFCALKHLFDEEAGAEDPSKIPHEIDLLSTVDHPNVVRLLGVTRLPRAALDCKSSFAGSSDDSESSSTSSPSRAHNVTADPLSPSVLFMVFEFMENGSVTDLMNARRRAGSSVNIREKLRMLTDAARGCVYLSNRKIIHRDLACRNLLVSKDLRVLVSDLGLSRNLEGSDNNYYRSSGGAIAVKWAAGEVLQQGAITVKSDVFSLASTAWELLNDGLPPFPSLSNDLVARVVLKGADSIADELTQPDECPDELYAMMKRCWSADPRQRPSMKQVLKVCVSLSNGDDSLQPTPLPVSSFAEDDYQNADDLYAKTPAGADVAKTGV